MTCHQNPGPSFRKVLLPSVASLKAISQHLTNFKIILLSDFQIHSAATEILSYVTDLKYHNSGLFQTHYACRFTVRDAIRLSSKLNNYAQLK